ncbi:MAG: S-layer homology domain-containing protein [Clostridiales bacterium]
MKKKLLGIFIFTLVIAFFPVSNLMAAENDAENTATTSAEKVYTIVINPGHASNPLSGKEPIAPGSSTMKAKGVSGATGNFTRIPEYVTTVSVGLALKEELQNRGYNVVMTKSTVKETLSNIDRAQIGNNNNADLVISIHADSSASQSTKGASMLVPAKGSVSTQLYDISQKYGKTIIDEYSKNVPINNRGLFYRSDITGFNWSTVPTVLIETGFLSNQHDDYYVSNVKNHPAIANAIANGIDTCFPYNGVFSDIRNNWALADIEKAAQNKYINGYPNGKFYPNKSITRAEFVKTLNAYFGLKNGSEKVFTDTKGHWAQKEIDIAVTNGACEGTSKTEFSPDTNITRQEVAKMIASYKKITDTNHTKINEYTDGSTIVSWAKDGVEGVLKAGYMNGYPDKTFRPNAELTRAEAVTMFNRIK